MRTVWLHVHVPKAGGSTIRQLMNRTFGKGYYNSSSLLETKQYSRQDVGEIIRCHPWLTGFSDHKLSLDLPFDSEHASVHALAFVRDPVERFVSRYNFHRNFEEVNCVAQQLPFRDFAVQELVQGFVHPQTNSQIRFLNGGIDDSSMEVVEHALGTGRAFLFPIERFDEACILLERVFPDTFEDLSYVPVNQSGRGETVTQSEREYVSELMKNDLPLLELAHSQTDLLLQKFFKDTSSRQEALEEFRDRCRRRYHNFKPPRGKDEPLPSEQDIVHDQSTNKPEHLRH